MQTLKRGILIGAAGQQGSEYFELLKGKVNWVALVDLNLEALSSKYSSYDIPHYSQLPDFISNDTCDFALVAVPHNQHMEVSKHLIERGVAVIKEKPLAQNNVELEVYQKLVSTYQVPIYTIVQRSFHPLLQLVQKRLAEIGPVYSFHL
jgi:predicted dehydrogenase